MQNCLIAAEYSQMKSPRRILFSLLMVFAGCSKDGPAPESAPTQSPAVLPAPPKGQPKVKTLANSEYFSWQVFDVAGKYGLIDGNPLVLGTLEQKWNIDLVLKRADYTETINMYGSRAADAVTITNTDILSPSLSRESVAILPTSTSKGADACLVVVDPKAPKFQDATSEVAYYLKGKVARGAEKSVSEYFYRRGAGKFGLNSTDVKFENCDPAAAAAAMIQKQPGFEVIVVWEPFIENILAKRSDVKVLFDSSLLAVANDAAKPLEVTEIVDMVVMGKDTYEGEGGKDFSMLLADTFYQGCALVNSDPAAEARLGEEFAHLSPEMTKVIRQKCVFFDTPDKGIEVFKMKQFPTTLGMIAQFSKERELITKEPVVEFAGIPAKASNKTNLTFETSTMGAMKTIGGIQRQQPAKQAP